MTNRQTWTWILLFFFCGNIFAHTKFSDTPRIKSIEDMLTFAIKLQRKPYKYGSEGPNAFDCSGFTRYCYKQIGIELKRTSKEQAENGKKIRQKKLKEGDLVFFKGPKGEDVNHVGIVYKKKRGKNFEFIHASSSSGITIESNETEYFQKRFLSARRITSDKEIHKILKQEIKRKKKEKK